MTVEVSDEVIQAVAEHEQEVARLAKENEKLRKENAERRIENRGLRLSKFDEDIRELIPKDLSGDDAEEYGSKLQAKVDAAVAAATGAETEAHEDQAAGIVEAPVAPSPLAAVSQPSPGTQTHSAMSAQEIADIAKTDPNRAAQIIVAQQGKF